MADAEVEKFDPFEGMDFDEDEADPEAGVDVAAEMAKLRENQRKLAAKIAADDEAKKIEAMKDDFYKEVGEDESGQMLAHIFLDGTETVAQVERAIKLIKTKAGMVGKAAPAPAGESDDDGGDAFAPPVTGGQTPPAMTKEEELSKQLKSGTLTFKSFLETFLSAPTGEWSEQHPE